MTKAFSNGESNLVNELIDISSDTFILLLETLSLPSTPAITGQTPSTIFPTKFSNHLVDGYCELQGTSTPLRLDWNTFVIPLPLFSQHHDINRLNNWALIRLQCRIDTIFIRIFKNIKHKNFDDII